MESIEKLLKVLSEFNEFEGYNRQKPVQFYTVAMKILNLNYKNGTIDNKNKHMKII